MKIHKSVTQDRVVEAIEEDDNLGFCLSCGAEAHSVEPDARLYECEECGVHQVYGAEQCLIEQLHN